MTLHANALRRAWFYIKVSLHVYGNKQRRNGANLEASIVQSFIASGLGNITGDAVIHPGGVMVNPPTFK